MFQNIFTVPFWNQDWQEYHDINWSVPIEGIAADYCFEIKKIWKIIIYHGGGDTSVSGV